jgi:hypothetical protein
MTEITQQTGSWTFDGQAVRIVPGNGKGVHVLRRSLGEVAVPLSAMAGVAYEPGRKGGRLRLRLRDGADPLAHVASGRLPDASDPYQLPVEPDRAGVAEYFVEEVRNALLLEQVPDGPCDRFLLPGPAVPLTASGTDGTASFDGTRVQLEWNWVTNESKKSGGRRSFTLDELEAVEWTPAIGWENGSLRLRPKGAQAALKPEHDPNCLMLWGVRQAKETGGSVLLAAAVTARLPHPRALSRAADAEPVPSLDKPRPDGSGTDGPADHDALLRRLRELGELHREGVLTDEEFTAAKAAVLTRF